MAKTMPRPETTRAPKVRRISKLSDPNSISQDGWATARGVDDEESRRELTEHVGGKPSVTERLLTERAVMLALKCSQIDELIMEGAYLGQHDSTMRSLGIMRCAARLSS